MTTPHTRETNKTPQRRSVRIPGFDYRQPGAYFVTICTDNRDCLFGQIDSFAMQLSEAGAIAKKCWQSIPDHFQHITLDEFVIMPNHMHGILFITDNGISPKCVAPVRDCEENSSFQHTVPGSLSVIVRSFKSASTRLIRKKIPNLDKPIWQRVYYEHVIRNENSLYQFRQYIFDNPEQWALDELNPSNW